MRIAIARYIRNPDNYFFDLFDAAGAGVLRQAGHNAVVVERVAGPGFDEAEVVAGLVKYLEDFGPDLVILPYLPFRSLAGRVKAATRARIAAVGSRLLLECPEVDVVLPEPDPLGYLAITEELLRGVSASPAEKSWEGGSGGIPSAQKGSPRILGPAFVHPIPEVFARCPIDYSAFVRLGPGRAPEVRKHIAGDWGCPYRNAPLAGEYWRGFTAPESSFSGGCAFCTRSGYSAVPVEVKMEYLGQQLDVVLRDFPDTRKLIVIDEHGLSFVDELAKLFLSRPTEGVDLLVSGRLDHVSRFSDRLEAALSMLAERNTVRLYQFGIENLSDAVLARYNKGMTYQDIASALWAIRRLQERWPNLGIEQSFGFILFDPWTTPEELRENVDRAASLAVEPFRGSAPLTGLRLYPELPLYWKAKQDGLLTGHMDEDGFGYSAGTGWRFRDPRTEAIHRELLSRRGRAEPWHALAACLGA